MVDYDREYCSKLKNKYCSDFDIVSITFDYYNGDDILSEPKLIFLCKVGNFDEDEQDIENEYFKLIFIKPSTYSIHVKTNPITLTKEEMLSPCKIYNWYCPFVCQMFQRETEQNHAHWEILFKCNTKEDGYISIYANDLKIEQVKVIKKK